MASAIGNAFIYFAFVFGTGFVLGPIRIFWLVPKVGTRVAELIEIPLMLIVIVFAARWINRRIVKFRLRVGLLALIIVIAAETAVGVFFGGATIRDVFLDRDPVSGTAYYASLVLFGLMPWLLGRHRIQATGQS